ncbi:MAG TPA: HEAT repeat domain-containing protein [Blastocatellia bacterium]|nr:HEAT repeat domain-containing protein [Blastocatellia bacterium]
MIWFKTAAFTVGYILTIWLIHTLLSSRSGSTEAMSLVLSFSITQGAVIGTLLILLLVLRLLSQIRIRQQRQLFGQIRGPLAFHVMGKDSLTELNQLYSNHPRELEQCLVEFLPSITGDGRERLCGLAEDLGLIAEWRRRLKSRNVKARRQAIGWLSQVVRIVSAAPFIEAVEDVDETVRLRASRALAKIDEPGNLSLIFAQMTTQPLLARALLVEDLRPHAMALSPEVIPQNLTAADIEVVIGTLDAIIAWGKVLPVELPSKLLRHPNPEVRTRALQALAFMTGSINIRDEVFEALRHGNHQLQTVAAKISSRMKMTEALPLLIECLHGSNFEASQSAAFAMAAMGPKGLAALQTEILSPNRPTAAVAFEAYERAMIKRLEY